MKSAVVKEDVLKKFWLAWVICELDCDGIAYTMKDVEGYVAKAVQCHIKGINPEEILEWVVGACQLSCADNS